MKMAKIEMHKVLYLFALMNTEITFPAKLDDLVSFCTLRWPLRSIKEPSVNRNFEVDIQPHAIFDVAKNVE